MVKRSSMQKKVSRAPVSVVSLSSRGSPGSFSGEVWEWIAPFVLLVLLIVFWSVLAVGWVVVLVAAFVVLLYAAFRKRSLKDRQAEKRSVGMGLKNARTPKR